MTLRSTSATADERLAKILAVNFTCLSVTETSKCNSFNEYVRALCSKNNMEHINVPGDGSCQYHAVVVGLSYLQRNPHKWSGHILRQKLANYVEENSTIDDFMEDTLSDLLIHYNVSCDAFLRRIRNPKWWGDSHTLILLSKFLDVQIITCQYNEENKTSSVYYLPHLSLVDDGKPRIYLLSDDEKHFQTMLPIEGVATRSRRVLTIDKVTQSTSDYPCPTCNRVFTTNKGCKQHRRLKHGENVSSSASESSSHQQQDAGSKMDASIVTAETSSIASTGSNKVCQSCQKEFVNSGGLRLHQRKCKKYQEDSTTASAVAQIQGISSEVVMAPTRQTSLISSLNQEDGGKQKHLEKFFASMNIGQEASIAKENTSQEERIDAVFKRPRGRPPKSTPTKESAAGTTSIAGTSAMDVEEVSFHTCSDEGSEETTSERRSQRSGRVGCVRKSRKRQIGQRRKRHPVSSQQSENTSRSSTSTNPDDISLTDSSATSRVTRSSTRMSQSFNPAPKRSTAKISKRRKSVRKDVSSSEIAASVDQDNDDEESQYPTCGTRKGRLPKEYKKWLQHLVKKYKWKDPKKLTSDCPHYNDLLNLAMEYEKNQETLVNEAKPREAMKMVIDQDQLSKKNRPRCDTREDKKRLKEYHRDRDVIPPEWPWKYPADNTNVNQLSDELLQLWRDMECQYKILHCPQCEKSGVLLLGDQLEAMICPQCMELNRMRGGENSRKEKLKKHLEEMKPKNKLADLPDLNAAEKAIIAPVHPVVTVTKNFTHKKKFKQECINLLRNNPDQLWSLILPRVTLKDRFVVIERRPKGVRRGMKVSPTKIYKWLEYLFENHLGFIQRKDEGTLKLSQAAMDELKKNDELEDYTDASSESDSDDDNASITSCRRTDPSPVTHHAEADAGFSKKDVYCFDTNPSLYMKQREFLKIDKDGKLLIIPDTDRRTPLYDPAVSSNMAFPELYPHGEKTPADIREFSLAKILLKYQTQFAEELKDKKLRWRFAEDSIHMMHEYSRLLEMEAHATTARYFVEQGSGASNIPIEKLLDSFDSGPDGFGKFDANIPELHSLLAAMKNTREFWFAQRLSIESICRDLGDANYFLTLNMEPRAWPEVRKLVFELEYGNSKVMDDDWFIRNNVLFTDLMDKYAVQINQFLEHRARTFLKTYLTDLSGIPEKEIDKDWRDDKDGRLMKGWYWGRPEFTETRGILHFHILAKLPNVIDTAIIAKLIHLGRLLREEIKAGNIKPEFKEEAFKYIRIGYYADTYACKFAESVSCAYFSNQDTPRGIHDPDDVIDLGPLTKDYEKAWKSKKPNAVNCRTHPIMREPDDPNIDKFPDNPVKTRNLENAKVAAVTGLHACIPNSCGGMENQSGDGCRFGMPKTKIPHTVCCVYPVNSEQVELQVLVRRTEGRCPNLNPLLLKFWRGNHDSTALFDAGHKLRYATKYVAKGPKHAELIKKMVEELRKRCNGIVRITRQQIVSHMILASASHKAFLSKHELAYKVMGLPLTNQTFADVKIEGYYPRFNISEIKKWKQPPKNNENDDVVESEIEEEIVLGDKTSYSAYAERLENPKNVKPSSLSDNDWDLMNFKDYCERVNHEWVMDKDAPEASTRRVRQRDKAAGYWIYRLARKRRHVRWSAELYSPPAYRIDRPDDITLKQVLYPDLSVEKKLQLNKAYQELVCYAPWTKSPDHTFLTETQRNKLTTEDPEVMKRHSRMRLEFFYQCYYMVYRDHPSKFAPIDSAWRRDQVYSYTMYQALHHNRDIYDERRRNDGVFKPEYLPAEELEELNVPELIQPDVDGVSEIAGDYPDSDDFLPSDIFQDILKQQPLKLDEITLCHPTQAIWQTLKSRIMPKKSSRERNWFLADPPNPKCALKDLTPMQLEAYKLFTSGREKILYVVGKAGSGKTELALHICKYFKDRKQLVQAGAGTAKAALLFNGPNLHCMFGWRKNEHLETFTGQEGRRKLKELQVFYSSNNVEIFILDEASALSASGLGSLNFTLQQIFQNTRPFGGKSVLFLGDPAQLRPVKAAAIYDANIAPPSDNSRSNRRNLALDTSYFQRSKLGQDIYRELENHCIVLKQGKRNRGLLQVIMDRVRNGEQTYNDLVKLRHQAIKFPELECDYGIHYNNDSCLMNNLKTIWTHASKSGKRVFVSPATYSEEVLKDPPSLSLLRSFPAQDYHFAADVLCLTEGAEVRLIENFNTKAGLVNSVTGIVHKIIDNSQNTDLILEGKFPTPSCIIVEFESFRGFPNPDGSRYYPYPQNKKLIPLFQRDFECTALIPREVLLKQRRSDCYRSQFPIDLARHVTCHRAQGQSWDNHNIAIDLELGSPASKIPNDAECIFYVAGTRTSDICNIFLQPINPEIWLKFGQSESAKARREVEKHLLLKAEEFSRSAKFYHVFLDEETTAKSQIPSKVALDTEWKKLQDCQVPPPSKGKPIIMSVNCPLSYLPGTCRPVDGERHIGIDQGVNAFAICVIDKFRGHMPILQAADLHNFSNALPLNFNASDLLVALRDESRLFRYMDVLNQSSLPVSGARKIERVVIHLEQLSIENPHFEEYTTELGELLQSRGTDLTSLIVKLSSPKVHRENGPTTKLGTTIVWSCSLAPSTSDKPMSQRLFEYLVNASADEQKEMNLQINTYIQRYWKSKIEASRSRLRLHDLGDAFLHALNEIVCPVSNYRQLIPADAVLKNNRSTLLYFLFDRVYWVTVSCYFNKFVLEAMGSYVPFYDRGFYLKGLNLDHIVKDFPQELKTAISCHDGGGIYPPVDSLRVIIRQTTHQSCRHLAAQLGCITNRAVEALEYYLHKIAPTAKKSKMTTPHYRYLRVLEDRKQFEVVRSTGQHTNNIITLLDYVAEYDPYFLKMRTFRLAPISQKEFFEALVSASERNSCYPTRPCRMAMVQISPNAQTSINSTAYKAFIEQKIMGDLILDNLNKNQKHVKAIAKHYQVDKIKKSAQIPPPLQRASSSGSKRQKSISPQPMDTDGASVCTCSVTHPCLAKKHVRIDARIRP